MAHNRGCAWRMIAEGEISKQGCVVPLESLLPLFLHLFVMIVSVETFRLQLQIRNTCNLITLSIILQMFCEQKEDMHRILKYLILKVVNSIDGSE
jgi:hypothetical protein